MMIIFMGRKDYTVINEIRLSNTILSIQNQEFDKKNEVICL